MEKAKEKQTVKQAENGPFHDEDVVALENHFIAAYLNKGEKPFRILFRLYRGFWWKFLVSFFFYVIKSSPVMILPIVTSNIINAVYLQLSGEIVDATPAILLNFVVMVILYVQNIPNHTLYVRFQSLAVRQVEAGLRGAMVRKLQQLSIPFCKELQSGRIQSKIMRDVETVQALSDQLFTQIPAIFVNTAIAVAVVSASQPIMLLFFLCCVPAAVALLRLFSGKINRNNHEYRVRMESTSSGLLDMVSMTEITRAHAAEDVEVKRMNSLLSHMANAGYRVDMIHALFGSCQWVVFGLFQLLCLLFSAYLALQGKILVGDITLYQSYFSTLIGQVNALVSILPVLSKGMESVRSIGEVLSSPHVEDNRGKEKITDLRGEYEFKNVRFAYEGDAPLLKGLNLHIKEGETIAIVGESGSGKTTLLNLLLGFLLTNDGQVLVDGKDIRDIDLPSYRSHLSVVPQNSVLFTGSIRDNITYGMPGITEEKLREVLQEALLTGLVDSLPDGVDTQLLEHGANLSGGQRQRIAIARAMIRNPSVIILDEATSALDNISEKEIQKAIANVAKGRTTFIVAHRLSTIRQADRIAVIEGGQCAEIGTFDELMEKKGTFYAMQTATEI